MPWYLRILTPFYSPDGAGGGDGSNDPNAGGSGGNDPEPTGGNDPATDPTPEPGKTFTQEQLDEIISKRRVNASSGSNRSKRNARRPP